MKKVLFQEKKIMKQMTFVENKTQIMQHVLKMRLLSFLPKYIKWISKGVLYAGRWKVKPYHSNLTQLFMYNAMQTPPSLSP
jgi:hypothetical protein